MKKILPLLILLAGIAACEKDMDLKPFDPPDNRNIGAGLYLPVYWGSKWVYSNYQLISGSKLKVGTQTTRYDSIPDFFFNYDTDGKFMSYGYWYRYGTHYFRSGSGQLLFTDLYIDSAKGKTYTFDSTSSSKRLVFSGTYELPAPGGTVKCIKTGGESGTYRWFRYFGYGIGVVREEEYRLNSSNDTLDHYTLELDSYSIKR